MSGWAKATRAVAPPPAPREERPETWHERVLREVHESDRIYAVLDGARDPRVRALLRSTNAPAWCLYRGELSDAVAAVAPWLVRLARGQPYTRVLLDAAWGKSWGILLSSGSPSKELRFHLRRFLLARTTEGTRLLFRYYDPRVLRAYLPTCTAEETRLFFGPLSGLAAEASDPQAFHVFRSTPNGLQQRRVEPFRSEDPALASRPSR